MLGHRNPECQTRVKVRLSKDVLPKSPNYSPRNSNVDWDACLNKHVTAGKVFGDMKLFKQSASPDSWPCEEFHIARRSQGYTHSAHVSWQHHCGQFLERMRAFMKWHWAIMLKLKRSARRPLPEGLYFPLCDVGTLVKLYSSNVSECAVVNETAKSRHNIPHNQIHNREEKKNIRWRSRCI